MSYILLVQVKCICDEFPKMYSFKYLRDMLWFLITCCASCQVIAESLSEEEIAGLREMFTAMDTDNSGQITFDELKEGLRKYGSTLKDTEIRDLMDAVSQLQFERLLGLLFRHIYLGKHAHVYL